MKIYTIKREEVEKDKEKVTNEIIAHVFSEMSDIAFDDIMPHYMKSKKFQKAIREITEHKIKKMMNEKE